MKAIFLHFSLCIALTTLQLLGPSTSHSFSPSAPRLFSFQEPASLSSATHEFLSSSAHQHLSSLACDSCAQPHCGSLSGWQLQHLSVRQNARSLALSRLELRGGGVQELPFERNDSSSGEWGSLTASSTTPSYQEERREYSWTDSSDPSSFSRALAKVDKRWTRESLLKPNETLPLLDPEETQRIKKHVRFPKYPEERGESVFEESTEPPWHSEPKELESSLPPSSISQGTNAGKARKKGLGRVSIASSSVPEEPSSVRMVRVNQKKLWEAALNAEPRLIRQLILEEGVDVNGQAFAKEVDIDDCTWLGIERTALHYACLCPEDENCVETVRTLLELGAEANAVTIDGDTPLHYAAMRGNSDQALVLLQHGANPHLLNYNVSLQLDEDGEHIRDIDDRILMKQMNITEEELEKFTFSPPMTPLEMALCAGDYSTPHTLMIIRLGEAMWSEFGRVKAQELAQQYQEGCDRIQEEMEDWDRQRGFTQEAFTFTTEEGLDRTFDMSKEAWEAHLKTIPDYKEIPKKVEADAEYERIMQESRKTFDFENYQTPPNIHPAKDPYPPEVPYEAREWATFESGEWLKENFTGEIVYSQKDPPNWPKKRHWISTPMHPEGHWQFYDPECTKDLTEAEKEKARQGNALREEMEEKWFNDPEMKAMSDHQKRCMDGNFPTPKRELPGPEEEKKPYGFWDEFYEDMLKEGTLRKDRPYHKLLKAQAQCKKEYDLWELHEGQPTSRPIGDAGRSKNLEAEDAVVDIQADPQFLEAVDIMSDDETHPMAP